MLVTQMPTHLLSRAFAQQMRWQLLSKCSKYDEYLLAFANAIAMWGPDKVRCARTGGGLWPQNTACSSDSVVVKKGKKRVGDGGLYPNRPQTLRESTLDPIPPLSLTTMGS